jgi:hypothetical protein
MGSPGWLSFAPAAIPTTAPALARVSAHSSDRTRRPERQTLACVRVGADVETFLGGFVKSLTRRRKRLQPIPGPPVRLMY